MDFNGSLCVLILPYSFNGLNWSLYVLLISPYASLWVLIGRCSFFYVRMESNVSLWVLISPNSSLWNLMGLYKFLRVLINFNGS